MARQREHGPAEGSKESAARARGVPPAPQCEAEGPFDYVQKELERAVELSQAVAPVRRAALGDWTDVWKEIDPLGWKNELGDWLIASSAEGMRWHFAACCCSVLDRVQSLLDECLGQTDDSLALTATEADLQYELSSWLHTVDFWMSYLPVMMTALWKGLDRLLPYEPELKPVRAEVGDLACPQRVTDPITVGLVRRACQNVLTAAVDFPPALADGDPTELLGSGKIERLWQAFSVLRHQILALATVVSIARCQLRCQEHATVYAGVED